MITNIYVKKAKRKDQSLVANKKKYLSSAPCFPSTIFYSSFSFSDSKNGKFTAKTRHKTHIKIATTSNLLSLFPHSSRLIAFTFLTSHLSELAGRLVTGLKIDTRSKQQYNKYTRPILNGVNKSKVLQRKCPPGWKKNQLKGKNTYYFIFYLSIKKLSLFFWNLNETKAECFGCSFLMSLCSSKNQVCVFSFCLRLY